MSMVRVKQPERLIEKDTQMEFAALSDAIDGLNGVLDDLRGFRNFEEFFDAVKYLIEDMEPAYQELEAADYEEHRREMEFLERQYWHDVI